MNIADRLAMLNAILNGLSGFALVTGWWLVRHGRVTAHRRAMLTALTLSAMFLVSYLTRVGLSGTHPYPPDAPARGFYLTMLAIHIILAATVPFLAVGATWLALTDRIASHRELVRVALPCWLVVSITGVGVYLTLYQLAGI